MQMERAAVESLRHSGTYRQVRLRIFPILVSPGPDHNNKIIGMRLQFRSQTLTHFLLCLATTALFFHCRERACALPTNQMELLLFYLYTGERELSESIIFKLSKIEINRQNLDGNTALNIAAKKRFTNCTYNLLKLGANPSIGNRHGQSPLFWAALDGDTNLIKVLLGAGGDFRATTLYGWTPRAAAIATGHTNAANLLGVNPTGNDEKRFRLAYAFAIAVSKGDVGVVKELIKQGADANTADRTGAYPLEAAIAQKDLEMVRLLLDVGASSKQKFLFDRDPIKLATERGFVEALGLLSRE